MNHSPAHITARVLAALNVGATPPTSAAWPVFVANEPTGPDNTITTFNTTGVEEGRTYDGELLELFGIQFRVRGKDETTGWLKAQEIREAISRQVRNLVVEISGTGYLVHNYVRIGTVISLGKEPTTSRVIFTINAQVAVTQV